MSTNRRKKKNKKNKLVIFAVEIVVLVLLLLGLYLYFKVDKVQSTGPINADEVEIELDSETKEALKGYTNIALFGLDNRSTGNYDGGNSDCIMIASINNDSKEVKLISVYRDTFLSVKEDTFNKVNSAYAYGGPKGAIAALNKNLNLDITNYVAVDFAAVVDAVDLLDGIELTLTDEEVKIMNDNYIDEINEVTKHSSSKLSGGGTYTVDGVQALAYCRIRYTAGDDFKRTERQREVIMAMADKAKMASVSTLNQIASDVFNEIYTSLDLTEIVELLGGISEYNIVDQAGFPYEEYRTTGTIGSKGSCVIPVDLKESVEWLHKFLFDEDYTASGEVQSYSEKIKSDTSSYLK